MQYIQPGFPRKQFIHSFFNSLFEFFIASVTISTTSTFYWNTMFITQIDSIFPIISPSKIIVFASYIFSIVQYITILYCLYYNTNALLCQGTTILSCSINCFVCVQGITTLFPPNITFLNNKVIHLLPNMVCKRAVIFQF